MGGGMARMMGELAQRYPPKSLVVSTGTVLAGADAASDARLGQTVDRLDMPATRLRTLQGLVRWTWRATSLVRRWKPGFAWCGQLRPAGYPARWLAARQRLPYGVFVYGGDLLLLETKIRDSAVKRMTAATLFGGAVVVVAISRWTADRARAVLEALGLADLAARVEIVPLGTTPSQFRPGLDTSGVRARYGLTGAPWLLTVARLDWHKGVDTMIRALPAVRAAHPATRYAVVGSGAPRAQLETLARDVGVGDAVRFLGSVPDDDLPALYNAADLYVGASRRLDGAAEGFGISLVEASGCGVAVVGGRSGGVADAVREGETGILVNPEDPADLAAGVTALLANPDLRKQFGAAGRRAVESYYNWDRVARDLIRIDAAYRSPARLDGQ